MLMMYYKQFFSCFDCIFDYIILNKVKNRAWKSNEALNIQIKQTKKY